MTEPLTLAQRLRNLVDEQIGEDLDYIRSADILMSEAAKELEADAATIASLRAANKAERVSMETALKIKADKIRDLKAFAKHHSTIIEAKQAKVEAERDEARRLVDGIDEERRGALDLCVKLNGDVASLSAELAEAQAQLERAGILVHLVTVRQVIDVASEEAAKCIDRSSAATLAGDSAGTYRYNTAFHSAANIADRIRSLFPEAPQPEDKEARE